MKKNNIIICLSVFALLSSLFAFQQYKRAKEFEQLAYENALLAADSQRILAEIAREIERNGSIKVIPK